MNARPRHPVRFAVLLMALPIVSLSLRPQDPTPVPAAPQPAARPAAAVKFRPPVTGAPKVRVTGGSRGTGDTRTRLEVLAPDSVGLTTSDQPSLFWYQSQPARARFELTLLREKQVEPLLQFTVDRAATAGVHRLRLADHGVRIEAGVEYQWVVALVTDPENRSSDIVASGAIQRVEPSETLRRDAASAGPDALASLYAAAGIWYDSLAALSDRIEASPNDPSLRAARVDLATQVGVKIADAPGPFPRKQDPSEFPDRL